MALEMSVALAETDAKIGGDAAAEKDTPKGKRANEAVTANASCAFHDALSATCIADCGFAIRRVGKCGFCGVGAGSQEGLRAWNAEQAEADPDEAGQGQSLEEQSTLGGAQGKKPVKLSNHRQPANHAQPGLAYAGQLQNISGV